MWPWIKRSCDWAMHELWTWRRLRPQPQALHFGYEKAGLTFHDEPIPWNAESAFVEAHFRLCHPPPRGPVDFRLRLPPRNPIPAESIQRLGADHRYKVTFRIPEPPHKTVLGEVHFLGERVAQLTLPRLEKEEFLDQLRLQMATLSVRLDQELLACQTFVSRQARSLVASAVLASPTSLAPLRDLNFHVKFEWDRQKKMEVVPVHLSSSQWSSGSALALAFPERLPRRVGEWSASWIADDQLLQVQKIRAISQRHFARSLRVVDSRFVIQNKKGELKASRQFQDVTPPERIGPCFMITSSEPGMAGRCHVEIRALAAGGMHNPLVLEEDVLISDGPAMVAPGTFDASDLAHITGFEVWIDGNSLGVLPLSPTPTATFTTEGGFKPPPTYFWSSSADEELSDRLNRLIEGRGQSE